MNRVSNRKHLHLLLLLGLGIVPALGLVPAILAPTQTPHGPGMGVVARGVVLSLFFAVGLTITACAVRKVPAHLELGDFLTVKYLCHEQVHRPDQVSGVSVEDRSVTLKLHGSIPMTAKDTMLTIHFADGAELSLSVRKGVAQEFQAAMQRWRQGASPGGSVRS